MHYGLLATVQKKIISAEKKIYVRKSQFQMKVNQDEDTRIKFF